jgi:ribosomal protein L22
MTEKNYNPEQKQMKTMKKQEMAEQKAEALVKKEEKIEEKKEETKVEQKEEKKEITKKQEKKIAKKNEAIVNGVSLPISTKTSAAICKFIKGKTIEKAITDLNEVLKFKRVIPMTGEIPHKKGKGVMSGRYPLKAIGYFIRMLKNLQANAAVNGLEEPVIVEAIPNRASLPYGRFGSIRRKRTHVKIKVAEKNKLKEKKK